MVKKLYVIAVAPHTGAWIETELENAAGVYGKVAPHTGVWIETEKQYSRRTTVLRRSPYGSVD